MRSSRIYAWLPWGAAALVAALLAAVWVQLLALHAAGPVAAIDRKSVVPKDVVVALGFGAVGVLALGLIVRGWRRSAPILIEENLEAWRKRPDRSAFLRALRAMLGGGMSDCEDAQQWFAHLCILWGFAGLFATTSLDALVNPAADPLPLLHPVRLLGNATGVLFMAGLTLALVRRALLAHVRAASRPADWTFLLSLWGTGASGFLVQWFADRADAPGTAWSYGVHLVFVALVIAAAPWTKFVHAAWRPTWILYRELLAGRRSSAKGC